MIPWRRLAAGSGVAAALLSLVGACAAPPGEGARAAGHAGQSDATAAPADQAAVSSSYVQEAHLIDARTGWALTGEGLSLTADGGGSWQDVTPPLTPGSPPALGPLADAIFADARHALAVSVDVRDTDRTVLGIHRTTDAGGSWSSGSLEVHPSVGAVSLSCLDAQTCSLVAQRQSSSNFRIGDLFVTGDGGQTWEPRTLPSAGDIVFVTEQRAWLVGGPIRDQLFVTSDAGLTWTPVSPPAPRGAAGMLRSYGVPTFPSERLGVLPFAVSDEHSPKAGFYVTTDGGGAWKIATTLPVDGSLGAGTVPSTSVVDRNEWYALLGGSNNRTLKIRNFGADVDERPSAGLAGGGNGATFVRGGVGWALSTRPCPPGDTTACVVLQDLFKTTDGGETWAPLRP